MKDFFKSITQDIQKLLTKREELREAEVEFEEATGADYVSITSRKDSVSIYATWEEEE